MTKRVTQIGSLAALTALAASAPAEVKLTENFSTSGYVSGTYSHWSPKGSTPASDQFEMDSAHLLFSGSFKPVTGVVSFFHSPSAVGPNLGVLDAYATYDAGNGVTVTGGKFLSWLGYESFFMVNNPTLTYANGDFLGAIPPYHSGVKAEYGDKAWSAGIAVVDSIYGGPGFFRGDGEIAHNAGVEAYFKYTAVPDLTIFAGVAHDTAGGLRGGDTTVLNLWAQYQVQKNITVAAEFTTKTSDAFAGADTEGTNWLVLLNYLFTDKINTAFRISGEDVDNGPSFLKFTAAPGVAVTSNLTVRAEVSYQDYKDSTIESATFFGVNANLKF